MRSHEYVVLDGINRAGIGRYLATLSATISALAVFVFLNLFDLAKRYGWSVHLTPSVMSLIGAGTVYLVLYWAFNRYLWRTRPIVAFLRVPNLEGRWQCEGTSYRDEGGDRVEHKWIGTVDIAQCWDRLRIRLTTAQSGSSSLVAAIRLDEAGGYRLFYNYANDPKIDQLRELRSHVGFCDMHIAADQQSAEGEYFNGRGRNTFGRMTWRRS